MPSPADLFADPLGRQLLFAAGEHVVAFLYVLARVSGLFIAGPLFGQALLTRQARVLRSRACGKKGSCSWPRRARVLGTSTVMRPAGVSSCLGRVPMA